MLQAPLQPLQDNLESQTYETFERDGTKYLAYEEAIYAALQDREKSHASSSGSHTVLMVVGAGRGPLIRSSLRAAERASCTLCIYAVEKNPNAVVTLQNLVLSEGYASRPLTRCSVLLHSMHFVDAYVLSSKHSTSALQGVLAGQGSCLEPSMRSGAESEKRMKASLTKVQE